MKRSLITALVVLLVGGGLLWWGMVSSGVKVTISPLGNKKEKVAVEKRGMEVVGFLPTWMVGKTMDYSGKLDQLIFLGVEVSEEGNLVWDIQGRKINNQDYLKMKERVKNDGGKNILGIKLFKDKWFDKLMADAEMKKKLIEEIKAIVMVAEFDGVNVDFEYMSNPYRVLDEDFGMFLNELRGFGVGEVSLDVFANTVIKGDSERLATLIGRLDKLIVMAYDFHQPSSDYVGPVAPIGSVPGERNISEVVQKVVDMGLDKKKIIMAYPLYGYEWRTVSEEYGSLVSDGWSRMVSYKEAKDRINNKIYDSFIDYKLNWDELSLTPWISFKNEENVQRRVKVGRKYKTVTEKVIRTYQVYFENDRSLEAKLNLAKQAGVAGFGFWALGYEGVDEDLWKMMLKYRQ